MGVEALSKAVELFLGSGGKCLLPFVLLSSLVGEALADGNGELDVLDCLFECTGMAGGSPFIVPGHGIATETSLH